MKAAFLPFSIERHVSVTRCIAWLLAAACAGVVLSSASCLASCGDYVQRHADGERMPATASGLFALRSELPGDSSPWRCIGPQCGQDRQAPTAPRLTSTFGAERDCWCSHTNWRIFSLPNARLACEVPGSRQWGQWPLVDHPPRAVHPLGVDPAG